MSKNLFLSLVLPLISFSALGLNHSSSTPFQNITEPVYAYEFAGKKFKSNVKNLKFENKGTWISWDFGAVPVGETRWVVWYSDEDDPNMAMTFLPGILSGSSDIRVEDGCGSLGIGYPYCETIFTFKPTSPAVKTATFLQEYTHPYDIPRVWRMSRLDIRGGSAYVPPAPDVNKPQCEQKKKGSIIRADSLSFGEEIPIIGTDYSLVYSSEYAPEYTTTYLNKGSRNESLTPEGWAISIHHFYDAANQRIYYGTGVSYPKAYGTYDGKRMVVNGSEVYLFENTGRHFKTLNYLTGSTKYQFGYNSIGKLISITDAFGNVTNLNRSGSLVDIVSPYGQTTQIVIDSRARVSQVVIPSGDSYKMSYQGLTDLLTNFETPAGRKTTVTYGAKGRLVSNRTGGSGWDFETYGKSGSSNVVGMSQISTMGRDWINEQYNYGANRYYRVETDPAGLKTMYYEEPDGSSTTVTPVGTHYVFKEQDPRFGNLKSYLSGSWLMGNGRQKGSGKTQWVEGETGNPFVYDAIYTNRNLNGYIENATFDRLNRELLTVSEGGVSRRDRFNELEQLIESQWSSDVPISYSYDARGRLIQIGQGANRTSQIIYDTNSNISKIIDPLGKETNFEYNSNGALVKVTDPGARQTSFVVDGDGNQIQVVTPSNLVHSLKRNQWGLLDEYIPPFVLNEGLGQIKYSYNADKEIVRIRKSGSHDLVIKYNLSGQVVSLNHSEERQSYEYSPKDGLLAVSKSFDGVVTSYKYLLDEMSQMNTNDNVGSFHSKMQINFDNSFKPKLKTFFGSFLSSPHRIPFSYDVDQRPQKVGELSIDYEAGSGRIKSTTLDKIEDHYVYDSFGQLVGYSALKKESNQTTSSLYSYNLIRDLDGKIVEKSETVLGVLSVFAYKYDNSNRLVEVKKNNKIIGLFEYDQNGNMTSKRDGRLTSVGSYDSQDRLLSMGQVQYSYNPTGSLEKIQRPLVPDVELVYSPLGNIRSYRDSLGNHTEFLLDSGGQRIQTKRNNKVVVKSIYDNFDRLVAQFNEIKATTNKYFHSMRNSTPEYMTSDDQLFRIISDHLGSPRLIVNSKTGKLKQRIEYDVWGKVLEDTNPGFQPFGFAGGLYDSDTKLVRFGARDYDAEVARWTSKDPILFDGVDSNLYGYVGNDPVNWFDADGKKRVAFVLTLLCMAYEAYDTYSTLNDIRNFQNQIAEVNKEIKLLDEEEDCEKIAELREKGRKLALDLAKAQQGYAKLAATAYICYKFQKLPF